MNLFAMLNRGAAHAPSDADRRRAAIAKAAEETRALWLDALLIDETRAWMSLGERQPELLSALVTMITIGGFVIATEAKDIDAPGVRIIRGAICAAEQCGKLGSVITAADAGAFQAAAYHAKEAIKTASHDSILRAAEGIRQAVGLTN